MQCLMCTAKPAYKVMLSPPLLDHIEACKTCLAMAIFLYRDDVDQPFFDHVELPSLRGGRPTMMFFATQELAEWLSVPELVSIDVALQDEDV